MSRISFRLLKLSLHVIPVILLLRVAVLNVFIPTGMAHGVLPVAKAINDFDTDVFVYLYHQHSEADSLNPQLAWYTNGLTCGWIPGKYQIGINMPWSGIDLGKLHTLGKYPDFLVVYYFTDNNLSDKVISEIKQSRPLLIKTKNYALFGLARKRSDNKDIVAYNFGLSRHLSEKFP